MVGGFFGEGRRGGVVCCFFVFAMFSRGNRSAQVSQ